MILFGLRISQEKWENRKTVCRHSRRTLSKLTSRGFLGVIVIFHGLPGIATVEPKRNAAGDFL